MQAMLCNYEIFRVLELKTLHACMQVMIFDYDVHHGNGTHDIFYNDPDILFVSTHQQGSYPGTGKLSEVGSGDAQHATINIPLPGQWGYRVGAKEWGAGKGYRWGKRMCCRDGGVPGWGAGLWCRGGEQG